MVGEIAPTPDAPASVPTGAADVATVAPTTPIVAAEPAAPVAEAPIADAPVEATPAEIAAEPEAPVEPVAPVVDPEKPAEEVKAEPEKPAPLAYEAFKLPEGFSPADEQISAFSTLIGEHQVPQETAQKLIDLHTSELKAFAEREIQRQQDVWDKTNADWQAEVSKKFGNRRDTVLNDAKSFVTKVIPDAKARGAFWDAMKLTGFGNHPEAVGFMARANKLISERAASPPPLPNNGRNGETKADRRYNNART